MMRRQKFFVYIVSNFTRTTFYVGVTNNLQRRLSEHIVARPVDGSFSGRYYCKDLVYWEEYGSILVAIAREKEIKRWRREKKNALVSAVNPEWRSLNHLVLGTNWRDFY